MNTKDKYLVMEITYKDIKKLVDESDGHYETRIYEKDIDRTGMSDEQITKQNSANEWYRKYSTTLRGNDGIIYDLIKHYVKEELDNGCRENLENNVFEKVYNHKLKIVASFNERNYSSISSAKTTYDPYIYMESGISLQNESDGKYIEDDEKLYKEFEACQQVMAYTDGSCILLEKVEVNVYESQYRDIDDDIKRLIKKFIREEFTYCIKNNKVVVPEEYIERGKEGIDEWRKLKASKNKSNSMENQILKQTYSEKKEYARKCIHDTAIVICQNVCWNKPYITVDGVYNKTRIDKLASELFNVKEKKQFMAMSDETILQMSKDYWKKELEQAIKSVDEVTGQE